MIRTSGEIRLSNYLLWQLAYSQNSISRTACGRISIRDELIEGDRASINQERQPLRRSHGGKNGVRGDLMFTNEADQRDRPCEHSAISAGCKGRSVLLYCVTAGDLPDRYCYELYRVMGIEKTAPGIAGLCGVSWHITGLVWNEGQQYVTLLAIAALMVLNDASTWSRSRNTGPSRSR